MSKRDREAWAKQNHSLEDEQQPSRILTVKRTYRWDVFHRLQELGIECECSTNKPLLVHLNSPTTIVQISSVVRQFTASRQELIDWLDDCWQVKYDPQSR